MNKLLIISFLFLSFFTFSQSKIATTEDGKRVLLRENNTWEYIDVKGKAELDKSTDKCNLASDYVEPKPDKNIQSWLKRVDATIEDLRKHIAVENECEVSDIKFLKISEQKGNGMYSVCVKGKEMKYRRIGSAFLKADEDPFPNKN
ncbi:MAG: hypothetical protein QM535_02815 [Limnohabitans sp.]|nr:hypothetical protein [Limnohabitans sp.]